MLPLSILAVHFVADFILQNNWMALGKSKRLWPLTVHAAVYAACFSWWGWTFVAITFITHWLTDFVTSRVGAKLWFIHTKPLQLAPRGESGWSHFARIDGSKRHWFFVWIGFDQLVHYATLAATLRYLYG